MFQPLQGSQKTGLFHYFLDHFWKDFRSPSFDTCLGRPVGNFGPILLNFESHLGLQGGGHEVSFWSLFGHFVHPGLRGGARGVQGEPQGSPGPDFA